MAWMDNYRAGLSHQQQLRMFNQLDSHDTARFKSLLGKDVARLPLAVVWLFSWPGYRASTMATRWAWMAQRSVLPQTVPVGSGAAGYPAAGVVSADGETA